jgi:hypothetical protein
MSNHKNHSFSCYPLECSQNERIKLARLKRQREEFETNENETASESILLMRMRTFLPDTLINEIGAFSGVVLRERLLVKVEYFDKWINDNNRRVMSLLDTWTKPHVAFVLTQLIHPCTSYLYGVGTLYDSFTKTEMAKAIKIHISNRAKLPRQELLEDYAELRRKNKVYCIFPHSFVPCKVNPRLDELDPIRVYGAYNAIEEYDKRLREKKNNVV